MTLTAFLQKFPPRKPAHVAGKGQWLGIHRRYEQSPAGGPLSGTAFRHFQHSMDRECLRRKLFGGCFSEATPYYLGVEGRERVGDGLGWWVKLDATFDAGLISLADDYHVFVKPEMKETTTDYGLKKLEGKKIRLPKEVRFWPGREWWRGRGGLIL